MLTFTIFLNIIEISNICTNFRLQNLQTRALLCVNNMLASLPLENLGGVNGVYKIWVEAGKLVFKQNSDAILLESATAVMRASLDKIKLRENGSTSGTVLFSDLAVSDLEVNSSYFNFEYS